MLLPLITAVGSVRCSPPPQKKSANLRKSVSGSATLVCILMLDTIFCCQTAVFPLEIIVIIQMMDVLGQATLELLYN